MSRKRVIIVDDDPALQDIFPLVLKSDLYDLTILTGAQELIREDYPLADLYILDKQLSGMDGLDLCKLLKSLEKTSGIPVVMLSASPSIAQSAKAAGADGWLEKPFKMKDLRALAEKFLQ